MAEDLIRVYAGDLLTKARNDDGTITVYGKAAGPQLDSDQQILDPDWLAREMPTWFQQWGNIREMHQAKAVGKAVELEAKDDDWFLTARIVDPDAIRKVEEGVLQGWSVGIKRPQIQRDAKAPGGRVVGGKIVENSLVDNACNETCKLVLAKAAGADQKASLEPVEELIEVPDPRHAELVKALAGAIHTHTTVDLPGDTVGETSEAADQAAQAAATAAMDFLAKRDVSTAERDRLASRGQAMEGGGFPIANVADLKNAIRALGRSDLIPDAWKADTADLGKFTAADIQGAISAIAGLIVAEAQDLAGGDIAEVWDITNLLEAVRCLVSFWQHEARVEGSVAAPGDEEEPMALSLAQLADLTKAATSDDASDEDKAALAEVTKALGLATLPEQIAEATRTAVEEVTKTVGTTVDGLAEKVAERTKTVVAEATKTVNQTVAGVAERVRKLEAQPALGGPARTTTMPDAAKSPRADTLRDQVAEYRRLADTLNGDPNGRAGLLTLAEQAERELAALT